MTALAAAVEQHTLISTDFFDTLVLRDGSCESHRIANACRAASRILGVDSHLVFFARCNAQRSAYQALSVVDSGGDVELAAICRQAMRLIGFPESASAVLHNCEVEHDIEHLTPNHALIAILRTQIEKGKRVVITTDTPYSSSDVIRMLDRVASLREFAPVYASSEFNRTKHHGGLFDVVVEHTGVEPREMLHIGDNRTSDVVRARSRSISAFHLPRSRSHAFARAAGVLRGAPAIARRTS